ncbi:MAG: septum formation initiator family protein [Acidobacteriaceae bacterium]|nr:septum formation initiator family protein [Acidobacteriaceae bacterium]
MLSRFLRPLAALAALAGLAAYATIMLRGPQGISTLEEKHRQIRQMEEQNANLARDIEAKKLRIQRLKNDPSLQELVVHDRLGKMHPGDTDFKESGQHIVPDAPKGNAAANSAK